MDALAQQPDGTAARSDAAGSRPIAHRALALGVALLMLAAVAVAGYAVGHSGGRSLAEARARGARLGELQGTGSGGRAGYLSAYGAAFHTEYRSAYTAAYRHSFRAASR